MAWRVVLEGCENFDAFEPVFQGREVLISDDGDSLQMVLPPISCNAYVLEVSTPHLTYKPSSIHQNQIALTRVAELVTPVS